MYPSELPYLEQLLAYYRAQDILNGWNERQWINTLFTSEKEARRVYVACPRTQIDRRYRSKMWAQLFLTQKAIFITTQGEWMGWSNSQKAENIGKILNEKTHTSKFKWHFPVFLLYWWEEDNLPLIPTAIRWHKSPHQSVCLQPGPGKETL